MFGHKDPTGKEPGAPPPTSPEEQAAFEETVERVADEKRRALADPGIDWKTWFFQDNSRWWIGLGFLVIDVWVAGTFLEAGEPLLLVPAIVVAVFLEYLLALYLWHRPSETEYERPRGAARPWYSPFRYGRWTPEAARVRAGGPGLVTPGEHGADPNEFL